MRNLQNNSHYFNFSYKQENSMKNVAEQTFVLKNAAKKF